MGTRRQRGEGSVYQDAQGQWWAKLPLGDGRVRRARCADRKDAESTLKQLRQQRDDHHVDLRASQQPVKLWLERWLAARQPSIAPRTFQFYQAQCEYMLPYIGQLKLEALQPTHIRQMLAQLQRGGLSATSCGHVRRVLHTALEMARRDRLVAENVAGLVEPPRAEPFEAYVLSEGEIAKLLAATRGERLEALLHVAVGLGLRPSEVRALAWQDYDREGRTLRVRVSKTAAGRRTLPLTDELCGQLDEHRARQAEEAQLPHWRDHGLIFPSEVGTALSGRNLVRWFKRIAARAGLPPAVRLYDLRHTAATDWIAAGGDPKAVQALMGHSSPQTTLKHYAKARTERMRDTVEAAAVRRSAGAVRTQNRTQEQSGA
jgi:integrase